MELKHRYTFFENFCLKMKPTLSGGEAWVYSLHRLPGSEPITFAPAPLKILKLLTSNPGHLFDVEAICTAIETGASDKLLVVRAQITILRGHLEDDADRPRLIQTVRKQGYRFISKAITVVGEEGEREWRARGFDLDPVYSPTVVTETSTDEKTIRQGDLLANCAQQSPSLGETVSGPHDNTETQAASADQSTPPAQGGLEYQRQDPPVAPPSTQDGEDPLIETSERELESNAGADIGDALPPASPLSDPVAIIERAPWRQRRYRWKIRILTKALFAMALLAWAFSRGLRPTPGSRPYYLLLGFRYGLWVTIPLALVLIVVLIVQRWVERARQKLRGNKISIFVTAFGEDQLGVETRERVVGAIREHLEAKRVNVVAKDVSISPIEADTDLPDLAKARTLLRREAGDLLIAGKVRAWPGKKERVELRFIPANSDPSRVLTFGFNPHYEIDADFGPDLAAALAATAGAFGAAAVADESGYVQRSLVPIAARLAPFAKAPPRSMQAQDQATLIFSYGLVQSVIGTHAGNPDALQEAALAFRVASENWGEDREPLKWARAQNHLGIVLGTLGAWGHGEGTLEASRIALEHALQKWPRETHLLNLAETHRNLGSTLLELGQAEGNPARFEEAVRSFIAARDAISKNQEPLSWASAVSGTAWSLLSIEESRGVPAEHLPSERIVFLEQVQREFEVAMEDLPGYEAPLAWLDAAEGIGRTLWWRGVCGHGLEPLKSAIRIFGTVLEESSRGRFPVRWGRAQRCLGSTISILSSKKGEHWRLKLAVKTLQEAAVTDMQRRMPLEWARLQSDLGRALVTLGLSRQQPKPLEDGLARLEEVRRICKPDYYPRLWAQAEYNRAVTLLALPQTDSTTKHLVDAIDALRVLRTAAQARGLSDYILRSSIELGRALGDLGARCDRVELLEEATALLQEVAEESARQEATRLRALAEYNRGVVLFELAQRRDSVSLYREAKKAVRTALGLTPVDASDRKIAEEKLALILAKLSAAGEAAAD
jgi:tetratricopeptide (TPR) repeat protein/DNA-binding winged helix-turn-helix (wHTH) protein